ncbi:unnamed protein product [Trichobilharzia szidati]|nr:unnamed protein product [Trichobilharzia szidati]
MHTFSLKFSFFKSLIYYRYVYLFQIRIVNFHAKLNDGDISGISDMFTQFNMEQLDKVNTDVTEKLYINYRVKTEQAGQSEMEACTHSLSVSNNLDEFSSHFEKDLSNYLSRLSKTGNYTFYSEDDVSNLINYLESFLGPPQTSYAANRDMVHSNPGLHLILLLNIPKATTSYQADCTLPLRFHIESSSSVEITDYALVPQWGGLLSIDAADCQSKNGEASLIAQKMIYTIRSILGFPQIREMTFDQGTDNQAYYYIQSDMDLNGKTTNWLDDQKYGIYTPLFVPIGFALFLSTLRAFKVIFRGGKT